MRIVFMGSGDIGLPTLRWLMSVEGVELVGVVTQPDKAAGRGLKTMVSGIKSLALEKCFPVLQPLKIRDAEAVKTIAALEPDVIVVMAYGQILTRELLEIPKVGCLNLHASLLPKHRGASPVHAALLAGDDATGITVMWMAEGLDAGDILCVREVAIAEDETAGSLHDRLAELAPQALADAFELLRRGCAPRIPQDRSMATYCGKLNRGLGRVEWNTSAETIARKVNALCPWPGSSAVLRLKCGRNVDVKIHRVRAEEGTGCAGAKGEGLAFYCGGGGMVRILELQAAGGKRMTGEDFLRGHSVVFAVAE